LAGATNVTQGLCRINREANPEESPALDRDDKMKLTLRSVDPRQHGRETMQEEQEMVEKPNPRLTETVRGAG